MSITEMTWQFSVDIKLKGINWQLSLVTDEQSILELMRNAYQNLLEPQLKDLSRSTLSGSQIQSTVFADALVLLRCLVLNRLEAHNGAHLKIQPSRR